MNAKAAKELRRIMSSIPDNLKKDITREEYATPAMREIYDRAMKDKTVNGKMKRKLSLLKDAGYLDKKEEVVNEEATTKIDKWLDEQIKRSIRLGRLPKPTKDEYNKFIGKKYVKQIAK